jgi:SHS2 domain-containing protein
MTSESSRWSPADRDKVYAERDHPADVLLEIWAKDLPTLFENALFALYDQLAALEGFRAEHKEIMAVKAATPAEALRSLLSQALYRFATERFVAARAEIGVETTPAGLIEVTAELHGETVDPERHKLLTEVKAVTYHRLSVEAQPDGGWQATVLLDV